MPNDWDSLIEATETEADVRLKTSVNNAINFSPDERAKDVDLAERFNLPVDTVANNKKEILRRERSEQFDYGKIIDETPQLADYLSDENNAAISQDDVGNMGFFERFIANQKQANKIGSNQKTIGQINPFDLYNDKLSTQELLAIEKASRPVIDFDLPYLAGIPGAVTETAPLMFSQITDAATIALPLAAASSLVASPATGLAVGSSVFTAGLYTEFAAAEANFAFLELMQETDEQGNPLEKEVAIGGSVATGVINGALELVGFKLIEKAFPSVGKVKDLFIRNAVTKSLKKPEIREALSTFGGAVLKAGVGEGATEAIQGISGTMIGEITKMVSEGEFKTFESDDPSQTFVEQVLLRAAEEFKKGSQAGIGFGTVGGSINLSVDVARARKSERDIEAMKALGDSAKESKTLQRSPQRMRKWVQSVKERYGTITDIYIPADRFTTYFQENGIDPNQVAREIGIDEQLFEATSVGGDLVIPLESYYTNIAGTDHHEALMNDARFSPEDFSIADTLNFDEERERLLDEELTRLDSENTSAVAENEVFNDVYQRLKDIGETDGAARQQAALYGAFFKTIGERSGQDPLSLYLGKELSIERQKEFQARVKVTMDDVFMERARNIVTGVKEPPKVKAAKKGKKRPLLDAIRKRGGINADSPVAAELNAIGIDTKTAPGLFKKTGGLSDIDNLPRSEIENVTGIEGLPDDGQGYVDRNELLSLLSEEQFADNTTEENISDLQARVDDFNRYINSLGVSFEDNTDEEIRAAVQAVQSFEITQGLDDPAIRKILNQKGKIGVNTFISDEVGFLRYDPLTDFREIGTSVNTEEEIDSALSQSVIKNEKWRSADVVVEDTETGEQFTAKAGDVVDNVKKNVNSITKLVRCLT